MKLRVALLAVALLVTGGLTVPSDAAASSKVVDITGLLNTECMIPSNVPLYDQCAIDDGYGSWIEESMPAAGSSLTIHGTTFAFPAHRLLSKDGFVTSGQVVPLGKTTGFKALAMLATQGTRIAGTPATIPFTVTYTDGSKTTQTVSVLNWRCQGRLSAIKGVQAQYIAAAFKTVEGCVDFVTVALNRKKAVASITMPPAATRFMVLSMSFTQTTSKPAAPTGPVFN